MAESSGSSKIPTKIYETVESECLAFVKECAAEFRWRDLSKDVIMDMGCGSNLNCCNAILKEFPDVKALVAVDENRSVFDNVNEKDERIQLCVGNIIKRDTLKGFEGKMDKIISTNLIHQVPNKKLAFENVYYMLKPGGEAAFLFALDTCFCPFMKAMLKDPPHQAIYKGPDYSTMYPEERRSQFYKQMLEEVGFHNVRTKEAYHEIPYDSDEACSDDLYEGYKFSFELPPESVEDFKVKAFQIFMKTMEIYGGKPPSYRSLMLSIMGLKPISTSNLKPEQTTV